MEPEVRGLVERLIDELITEGLIGIIEGMSEFTPIIKSEEDAVFGYIIGVAQSTFIANYKIMFNKPPDKKATMSFNDILQRRAMEIKDKIRVTINR